MGYYVPNNIPITSYDTVEKVFPVEDLSTVADNLALIVVVENPFFHAYALAYDQQELDYFNIPDGRKRTYYVMDKTMAHRLSNYNQ